MPKVIIESWIKKAAIESHSFPKKCYPNEITEKQCQLAFIEGAEWAIKQLNKETKECK